MEEKTEVFNMKDLVPTSEINPAELTTRQAFTLQKVTASNLERLIADAEALVQFSNRIKTVALKATTANDWIMLGGNPYLKESGVKSLLRLIGASVYDLKIEEEVIFDEKLGGKVGYFTAEGKILFNGNTLSNIGVASTKDLFFAKRFKDGKEVFLNYDEVDKANVRKKAVTNLQKRLLDCVLKLAPTPQELEKAGIKIEAVVEYGKGTSGGKVDSKEEKDERLKLKNTLARLSALTGEPVGKLLQGLTAFNDFAGYTEPDRVSPKMLSKTLKAVENKVAELEKAQGESPADKKPEGK